MGRKDNETLPYLPVNELERAMISISFFSLEGIREGQYSSLGRFCFHLQNVFNLCRPFVLVLGSYF